MTLSPPNPSTAFIEKWSAGGSNFGMSERAGAQPFFIDLCAVLGVPTPDDPAHYSFERLTEKMGEARGWADVFKRRCFGWENKAPGGDLKAALKQLKMYASALDNPPLLIVSDRLLIQVYTQFTGTPTEVHEFRLKDLADPAKRETLRKCWTDPDWLKPKRTSRDITKKAADAFASVAQRMRDERQIAPERVSHFLTQCVFCFFAEDVGLLPEKLFDRLVSKQMMPDRLRNSLVELFTKMRDGGLFGVDDIPWFNGGLFKTIDVPELTPMDVTALRSAAYENWSAIDVSIFGTLFERGLNPKKRSQLGAHYTDPHTIMRIVEPVVQRPLIAEWTVIRDSIAKQSERGRKYKDETFKKAMKEAQAQFNAWLERLRDYRVLDPACGSGNFLFLALKSLKDIELATHIEAEKLGLQRPVDMVTSPANVLGIELDEYAAELARVTVWIGELQWCLEHGFNFKQNPVLEPLDHIENRDALLTLSPSLTHVEALWPRADAVTGNPPFVGDKKMRAELGDDYTEALRKVYAGRVPGGADLVTYWFEKARTAIANGDLQNAGLVSTNSIRQRANRSVLQAAADTAPIFDAWSDEEWVNEGAAVRVSLVAFGRSGLAPRLNGEAVTAIFADLKGANAEHASGDLTQAKPLAENADASYFGFCLAGPFKVDQKVAQSWLAQPNPHQRPNSDVLKPIYNGSDITRRWAGHWVVDFGASMSEADAAMYEAPFRFATSTIQPIRATNREAQRAKQWWRHGRPRPELRSKLAALSRYIATVETAKHRTFVFFPITVAPEHSLIVIPRADDATFGVLSSRLHTVWALARGGTLEDRPRYNSLATFEPFPFPPGLTPRDTAHQRVETLADGAVIPADLAPSAGSDGGRVRDHAIDIARAAKRLNDLREAWLNPPEWTERVAEVTPLGMTESPYPDRVLPKATLNADALKALSKRTLTNLYNERPAWLANAHAALDAAVAAAYGWNDYAAEMSDDEILSRLLALNHERSRVDAPSTSRNQRSHRGET